MITFIIVGCIMLVVCLLALLLPLGRKRTTAPVNSGSHNVEIAKEKLADLELQKESGAITEGEFNKLSADAKQTLVLEVDPVDTPSLSQGNSLIPSIIIAALVPVFTVLLYLTLGSPEGLEPSNVSPQVVDSSGQSIDSLLQELENRLAANPDDAEGWNLLGRTYMSLQRFAQAQRAFTNLRRIIGDEPNVLLQLADAEINLNGGLYTATATRYVTTAYAAEPDNIQAIWMASMLNTQEGNLISAISKWERLEILMTGQPEQQAHIGRLLAEARTAIGQPSPEVLVADAQTDSGSISVTIEVSVAANLPKPVTNEQTVYIYARAASGPPMPLAVKQLRVADLPAKVTLTEQDAMIANMTLAQFPQVVLGARISMTGEPTAQTGDIQNITAPLNLPVDGPVSLEIKDLVK